MVLDHAAIPVWGFLAGPTSSMQLADGASRSTEPRSPAHSSSSPLWTSRLPVRARRVFCAGRPRTLRPLAGSAASAFDASPSILRRRRWQSRALGGLRSRRSLAGWGASANGAALPREPVSPASDSDIYVFYDSRRHCANCRERLVELRRAAAILGRHVFIVWSVAR